MKRQTIRRGITLFLLFNFLQSIVLPTLVSNYDVFTGSSVLLKASNNGPNAPEAAGFEPVDATDMVNLNKGDLSYVLPLLEIPSPQGGFPVSMSYHAGITHDMEASWVGLGWYLTPGAINRFQNGLPDDWRDGRTVDFSSYQKINNYYSVSVNYGFDMLGMDGAASVGVGLSWGGNQGLTGSVSASLAGASVTATTTGAVSVGFSPISALTSIAGSTKQSISGSKLGKAGQFLKKKLDKLPVNVSVGVSYSLQNQWDVSGGVTFAKKWASNRTDKKGERIYNFASTGVSFSSSGGAGFSVGAGSGGSSGGAGGGAALATAAADISTTQQSKGISLPTPLPGLSVGLRKTKVTIKQIKGYRKHQWGTLYTGNFYTDSNEAPSFAERGKLGNKFSQYDYSNRDYYMDVYEQVLPQEEDQFVGDNEEKAEKVNFTFMGYDTYSVSGLGIGGVLQPRMFRAVNLVGAGSKTGNPTHDNSTSNDDKMHVFYHKGSNLVDKQISGVPFSNYHDFHFYFNGQINNNCLVSPKSFRQDLKNRLNNYNNVNMSLSSSVFNASGGES